MTNEELVTAIAKEVFMNGGDTYFVGGCVRDMLLAQKPKDIDIEVHRVTSDTLKKILNNIGECTEHGKSFGVYGIKGYDIDISLPRSERRIGNLHTDFEIGINPLLTEKEASKRRDFTINSLMQNVITSDIIDYWGGITDLAQGIIRHIDEDRFIEDPLRVLRAARFSAKLGFDIAPETIELCKLISLSHLSRERVFGEMIMALLKSDKPSIFFEQLRNMKKLDYWFPELKATINCPQNETYHAEGDVWTHTMMVVNEAAKVRDKVEYPLGFMMTALCHDLGKPLCTTIDEKGIHSYRHETAGLPVVKEFISRLTNETKLINYVLNMTENHMRPHKCAKSKSSLKKTNHMFDVLITPHDLVMLAIADDNGRICDTPSDDRQEAEEFLWDRLKAYEEIMSRPFIQGRDLIQAGLTPDKSFSELLAHAHKLRLAGIDKDNSLRQVLAIANKKRRKLKYD